MAVEALAAMVVDSGRAGISVPSGELDVSERNTSIERGHDEGGPEHVGVDVTQS